MAKNTEQLGIHVGDENEYDSLAFVSQESVCVSVRLTDRTTMYFNSEAQIRQLQTALADAINRFNSRTVKLQEERSSVLLAAKEYGIEMTPETAAEIVAQDAVNNPPCPVCGTPGCCEHEECPECGQREFHTATCWLVDNGNTHSTAVSNA